MILIRKFGARLYYSTIYLCIYLILEIPQMSEGGTVLMRNGYTTVRWLSTVSDILSVRAVFSHFFPLSNHIEIPHFCK